MEKITYSMLAPTEDEEQAAVIEWAELNSARFPCLEWLYAIPNGGKRDIREAVKFKKTGVKAGVPDLHLPIPKGKYHGLYIEMKRRQNGRLSPEQRKWLRGLTEQGYYCAMCKGSDEAIKVILNYIKERIDKE